MATIPSTIKSPSHLSSREPSFLYFLLLGAYIHWLYVPILGYEFVWDDYVLLVYNPLIREPGFSGLWKNLGKPLYMGYGDFFSYFRPLQSLSYWLDYRLWQLNPFGYHLENILLHGLNTLLVFALMEQLTHHKHASLLAAGIYAAHPIHVGTVAYIAGRADLLVIAFFLGMVLYFQRRRDDLASVCFAFALGAKELALMGLPLLIVWNRLLTPHTFHWKRFTPFLCLIGVYLLIRTLVLKSPIAPGTFWLVNFQNLAWGLPWITATQCRILLFPKPSQWWYTLPTTFGETDPLWFQALGVFILQIASCSAVWRLVPRMRPPLTWLVLASLAAVPVYAPANTSVSEHWLILPLIGLCGLMGLTFTPQKEHRWHRRLRWTALALMALTLGSTVRQSLPIWSNNRSVFSHLIKQSPNSALLYANYSDTLRHEKDIASAIEIAAKAVELDPSLGAGWVQLGWAFLQQQNWDQSQWAAERAISLNGPFKAGGYYILGSAKTGQGQFDQAEEAFRQSTQLDPNNWNSWISLGNLYARQGRWADAAQAFKSALNLRPDSPRLYQRLAIVYEALGDHAQAQTYSRKYQMFLKRFQTLKAPSFPENP